MKSVFTALIFIVFCAGSVFAAAEETGKPGKFDPGKMIIGHVADQHEWHILGEGKKAVVLPLPVIVYTPKGLDVFLSNKFDEESHTYQGKYLYQLDEHNQVVILGDDGKTDDAATKKLWDFSITKNVASLFFSAFLLLYVFLNVAGAYKRKPNVAPSGLQSALEPIIIFIRDDIAKQSIGPKYERYMPYLLTIFFFIWFNNMLGIIPIIPGGANVTGNIAVTGTLALLTFIIIIVSSNRNYWHHIFAMPGVPKPVLLILTPIEIMGVFLRPFVLMIRLFANILAGHIIALSFLCLVFIFGATSIAGGLGAGIFATIFNMLMGLLELLVALIQAYVFTLLSAIYFGAALEDANHDGDLII